MHAAVIAMGTDSAEEPSITLAEAGHARAIAEAMPNFGLAPCLICPPDSPLAFLPVPIPRLCIKPRGLSSLFQLWQWQRKYERLFILAVGQASMRMARWLAKRGNKGTRESCAAFFLRPPTRQTARQLEQFEMCLCGSQFIIRDIEAMQLKHCPRLELVEPGIDLNEYEWPPKKWENGDRFVFGMGESLKTDSGALLLARAMSALWQQDDLPAWEVRMFGGGPRFEEILDEADKLGVMSRLAILNEQPLGEVSRHCHVWIAPSVTDDELPQTLWAGFAAGLPVVAAKSPLHTERTQPDAALEIQMDNPQKMAKVMLRLMRDEKWRAKMADAGSTMRPYISLQGMAKRVCGLISGKYMEVEKADRAGGKKDNAADNVTGQN